MSYDPNSQDAMFSRLLSRLDGLDQKLDRIEEQTIKTNGRVGSLERLRDVITAQVVMVSAFISLGVTALAWAVKHLL